MSGPRTLARLSRWSSAGVIAIQVLGVVVAVAVGIYAVAFQDAPPWFLLVIAFGAFWLWKIALPAIRA